MSTLVTLAGILPVFATLVVVALALTLAQDLWAGWTPVAPPAPVETAAKADVEDFLAALSRPSGYTQAADLPEAAMCRLQPKHGDAFERHMALERAKVMVTVMTARFVRAITQATGTIITWATAQVTVPGILLGAPLARPVRAVPAAHYDGVARLRLAIH
jgi:hypothetical protein